VRNFNEVIDNGVNLYAIVAVRSFTKRTTSALVKSGTVTWNQTKHFPLIIARNYRHPYNLLQVNIVANSGDDPDYSENIGTVFFHLHDLIQASPISGCYDLWNENVCVGSVRLELTFSYGAFGYGSSSQVYPRTNKTDRRKRNRPFRMRRIFPVPASSPAKGLVRAKLHDVYRAGRAAPRVYTDGE
jgi:hypothetical protein